MARFNTGSSTKTTNLAGGEAFEMSPKLEFVSILLTSMVQNSYYESSNDTLNRVRDLVKKISDKEFLARVAVYARNEFGMRSISHVIAAELAHIVKGQPWNRKFLSAVVRRPDDMTETMAYYLNRFGKPIPNAMKRGFADAFGKFDAYQLAKYRSAGKTVSLVDVVNLVRPKPTEKNAEALEQLVNDTLRSRDTWESKISDSGQGDKTEEEVAESKKQSWVELIESKKLPYFALLKNLRNIKQQAPEAVDMALQSLTNKNFIKSSLVLPFRFLTAYTELEKLDDANKILEALATAAELSVDNIPVLDGKTLVAIDTSGSMECKMSENSIVQRVQIALLFGLAMARKNDTDIISFASKAEYISINRKDSLLGLALNSYRYLGRVGHGTDLKQIFIEANKAYDRVFIFSDMQGWLGYHTPSRIFREYCRAYDVNSKIYSVDLAGYGTLQFPENNVYCVAGFSEKIFDIMSMLEQDKKALIHTIEQVEF